MDARRRRVVIVLMWAAALVAVGAIYVWAERPPDPRRRSASGIVEHDAEDTPLGSSRTGRTLAPIPEGPPSEYRGDRRHTGRSPFAGPTTARRAWSFHTDDHIAGQVVIGPDGTAYVGSLDHYVYALDDAGALRWRTDLGGPVFSTPVVDGDRLYVGSDSDRLFCLSTTDGSVLWHLRTEGDLDTGIARAPDGSLVFGAGEHVWSVSPSGEANWRFRARVKVYSAPAIDDDGTVYFGAQDDYVYALSPAGELLWRFETPDDVDAGIVIGDDGTLYFGGDDRLVRALSPDGVELWHHDVDGYIRAPAALGRNDDLIVPVFGPRPRVVSLDLHTGDERWDFPISAGASSDLGVGSSPVVDRDGNLYFGADDFYLYALSPDGALRWVFRTADRVDSDPIIGPDGTLYFGSDDAWVYALR